MTLIERMSHPLPNEDADAAAIVASALRADGVQGRCGAADLRVTRLGDEHFDVDGLHHDVVADELLVGVGRTLNVDGLGLRASG